MPGRGGGSISEIYCNNGKPENGLDAVFCGAKMTKGTRGTREWWCRVRRGNQRSVGTWKEEDSKQQSEDKDAYRLRVFCGVLSAHIFIRRYGRLKLLSLAAPASRDLRTPPLVIRRQLRHDFVKRLKVVVVSCACDCVDGEPALIADGEIVFAVRDVGLALGWRHGSRGQGVACVCQWRSRYQLSHLRRPDREISSPHPPLFAPLLAVAPWPTVSHPQQGQCSPAAAWNSISG
ncbi:hypothetical protein DFH09DRAFT_559736 [Mycena vulgaris]|nr:hypothetical protein DFH09DRAFT_559736 [Mycena vulgaris]